METISQLTRSLSRISTNQAQLIAMMESRQPRNMMDIKTNINQISTMVTTADPQHTKKPVMKLWITMNAIAILPMENINLGSSRDARVLKTKILYQFVPTPELHKLLQCLFYDLVCIHTKYFLPLI